MASHLTFRYLQDNIAIMQCTRTDKSNIRLVSLFLFIYWECRENKCEVDGEVWKMCYGWVRWRMRIRLSLRSSIRIHNLFPCLKIQEFSAAFDKWDIINNFLMICIRYTIYGNTDLVVLNIYLIVRQELIIPEDKTEETWE